MMQDKSHTLDPVQELELLAEVSQLLISFDMSRVLGKVLRLLSSAVGAQRAHLALHPNFELDWRQIYQTDHLDSMRTFSAALGGLETGLAGYAAQERKAILIPDLEQDARRIQFTALKGVKSAMALPFIYGNDLMAVLLLTHPDAERFGRGHLRLATTIINQAAIAMHNARLHTHVRGSQRQFEVILRAMGDIILVLDKRLRVVMLNVAGKRLLDLPETDDSTVHLSNLAAADTTFTTVQQALENSSPDQTMWTFKAYSEQRKRDFEAMMAIWENPLQGRSGYVVMLHDVTDLYELNRFKNEILRMASHDLRSPLAIIEGYCDLIELDMPEDASGIPHFLDSIRHTTGRMNRLLNDLLRIDQIQNSPLELHQVISIPMLLDSIMSDAGMGVEQKHQHLIRDFENLPQEIVADPMMLREAMENLVSNAIKYTPEGGQITIRAYASEDRFHFEVQDNGVGIGAEHLPRLFNSFYRAKQAGTEHVEGSGVGLNLVKTVVERHGGQVWVESKEGEGSTFGLWLPLPVL